jgi:hypothetical protein
MLRRSWLADKTGNDLGPSLPTGAMIPRRDWGHYTARRTALSTARIDTRHISLSRERCHRSQSCRRCFVSPGTPVPGLPEMAPSVLADMETYDSPIPMRDVARTFGVDQTPASVAIRTILCPAMGKKVQSGREDR